MVFFWESHIRAQRSCQMPSVHDHLAPGLDKRGMAEPMTGRKETRILSIISGLSVCFRFSFPEFEGKDDFPVVLHADDEPAILLRLVVKRLGEGADLGVRQSLSWAVGILALGVVVQNKHRQPRAVAGFGVFEHLLVAGRIAERGDRPSADY